MTLVSPIDSSSVVTLVVLAGILRLYAWTQLEEFKGCVAAACAPMIVIHFVLPRWPG